MTALKWWVISVLLAQILLLIIYPSIPALLNIIFYFLIALMVEKKETELFDLYEKERIYESS